MENERLQMSNFELDINNLTRLFKDVRALDDFSLHVNKGELISLLGPSGCGKTTALRILAGLDTQNSGSIKVSGRDISSVPANKRNMGMVFQAYSLFPNLTAAENVAFGLQMRKVNKSIRQKKADELLELVGLPRHAKRFPHQLSGGQQQRVALARALAFEPDILLLDEPLSALDAQVRTQVREEIRRIQLNLGITTIFVTHDQEEAMAISDRVAVMNSGKLEQIATPEELYKNPTSPFVISFVGQINKIPTHINSDKTATVFGKSLPLTNHVDSSENLHALIRPEAIAINNDGSGDFRAIVAIKSFLGPITTLGVSVEGMPLIHVHLDSSLAHNIQIGDSIGLDLKLSSVMVG